ncbi:MAG: type II toxin-antitoxin system VapC family toxin [Treponema sp.]|jgi:PIN domain nuclease of toxin-antitoxin system|nr:type II toxin-antitoxin system VapC family toxin [Treponema sp.]
MIHFLLDTNVVIWLSEDQPRINQIKDLIFSVDAQIFISAVSWWEMAIKVRTGKLQVDVAKLRALAEEHDFQELPLHGRATEALINLPKLHKDPFDHILLAQAITEPMRFITGDGLLADYSSLVMVI